MSKPAMIRIKTLSEREIANNVWPFDSSYGNAMWDWLVRSVAEEFECSPDDIHEIETDDEGDIITVRGVPAARIIIDR